MLRTGQPIPWTKAGEDVVLLPAQSDFTPLDDVVSVTW